MNKYEIVKKIEDFAPLNTQEEWDASGWIVDNENPEVNKIMFALTITQNIYEQAIKQNCEMIIAHHPLFFVPYQYKKINMYCAHTNFDKANGGTTDTLIKNINMTGTKYNDFVRIVEFDEPMGVEYLKLKLLKINPRLKIVNNLNVKTIKKIGFCSGSGSEFISSTPCDAFVTGDIKYHTAIESNKVLFDIGHFESEIIAVQTLKDITEVDLKGILANEETPFK